MNPQDLNRDELMSMLFAEMVVQQTNMALILLGKVPHPQTGKTERNLDAARLFVDQLEMLEVKTKGNLSKEEESLLKQSLSHLRLAYVDVVNQQGNASPAKPAAEPAPGTSPEAPQLETPPPGEEESRKRFTKKY